MVKKCLILLLCLVSLSQVFGQDGFYVEACELDIFNSQIDTILNDYLATRNVDGSTDGALMSIAVLNESLSAVYQDCLQAQQEARLNSLEVLLNDLYDGGYIIYVRHTHTDRSGSGDIEREGCEGERNLSTRGRIEAQAINDYYVSLELPVGAIITTELCRTQDTTELAFGDPTEIIPRSELEGTLADVLTVIPNAGTNTIIVAHVGTLQRNFGLPIPFDEGDAYVFQPMGEDGVELVGRIGLGDWELLSEFGKSDE